MDDQHSRATRARVVGLRARPAVPEDSRQAPIACGIDQLSRLTQASVRGPAVLTSSSGRLVKRSVVPRGRPAHPCDMGPVRKTVLSSSWPWQRGPGSEGPRCRPTVPGDSGLCPRARGVDHMSQATLTRVRGPAVSTNTPGRLGFISKDPRGRPYVPCDSGPCPRSRG